MLIKFIPWGAMSIVGLRALLAAVVFALYRKSIKVKLTRGNILAALCLSSTTILFVFSNKMTTAAAAILLQFTAPVFIILIHLIFYKQKPRLAQLFALMATVAGMVLFFFGRLEGGYWMGNVLAVLSGVSFAGVFVCNRREDTQPEQALFLGFVINACLALPFAFFEVTVDMGAWAAVIVLGIVQVGLAYVFFSVGIRHTHALSACFITALEPVLNPVWVALFYGERPSGYAIAGGVIIILAVLTYNVWEARNTRTAASSELS